MTTKEGNELKQPIYPKSKSLIFYSYFRKKIKEIASKDQVVTDMVLVGSCRKVDIRLIPEILRVK